MLDQPRIILYARRIDVVDDLKAAPAFEYYIPKDELEDLLASRQGITLEAADLFALRVQDKQYFSAMTALLLTCPRL